MTDRVATERDGPVLIIRLSDPKSRNSLTLEMRAQLGHAVAEAEQDSRVRAVYLTGQGPTFCSGGDLNHLQTACDPWTVHRRFRGFSHWLIPLMTLDKPVVVGVNGHAVGGGMGLALTGDVVLAGEGAQFISGFFRIGAIPDIAIMYLLPRLIGMAQTKNFLYSGGAYTAAQAAALGLVSRVVPDDALYAAGLQEARRLAEGPAPVMGLAKTLMARSFETTMTDMLAVEGLGQALAMSHPEFREGLAAALQRRPANFIDAPEQTQTATRGEQ